MKRLTKVLIGFGALLLLGGCSQHTLKPVAVQETPMDSLSCAHSLPKMTEAYIGVGSILDLTGKSEPSTISSTYITQAGTQILVSELYKAGAKLVNRHNVSVMVWEKENAMGKWLGDGKDYRKIPVGSLIGSDYIVTGSISTLDFNTQSGGVEISVNGVGAGVRAQEIDVSGDIMITDTRTGEIVFAKTYQMKLYTAETKLGAFHMWDGDLYNISAGKVVQDPLQFSVRYLLEKAALDIMANVYEIDASICLPKKDKKAKIVKK